MSIEVASFSQSASVDDTIEQGWLAMRLLAAEVKSWEQSIDYCALRIGAHPATRINAPVSPCGDCYTVTLAVNPYYHLDASELSESDAYYRLDNLIHCEPWTPNLLPEGLQHLLRVYVPYCFASMHARRWQRAFAVSHFAQSLDGRIATVSGDSKWIGNHANLIHAHRMRALCDGILIGAKTLVTDKPQLTVRHVSGANPTRIVLGAAFDSLNDIKHVSEAPICVISSQPTIDTEEVKTVTLARHNGLISSAEILKALYQLGIDSVYIEGGAATTSHFLRDRMLDVVQLHIAPMIFGSGLNAFAMPIIQQAAESIRFASHTYVPVDDDMMFVGTLHPQLP